MQEKLNYAGVVEVKDNAKKRESPDLVGFKRDLRRTAAPTAAVLPVAR